MKDLTIEPDRFGNFDVVMHDEYPHHSVLAGRSRRTILDTYETAQAAQDEYPTATVMNHSTRLPSFLQQPVSDVPPDWFDPADAGEEW